MASSAAVFHSSTFSPRPSLPSSLSPPPALHLSNLRVSTHSLGCKPKPLTSHTQRIAPRTSFLIANSTTFHGHCYVVGDDIDINQMIPAADYSPHAFDEKFGPQAPFMEPNQAKSKYSIVIAGSNFCLPRRFAPMALEAFGVAVVVASSYQPGFLRNSAATSGIHPLESEMRICEECETGDIVTVELGKSLLINHSTGKVYKLNLVRDAGPVVETGGGGRHTGKMIPSHWAHIIVGSLSYLVMVTTLLLVGPRRITINNIINDHRQSLPTITSIQNHNRFGVSVNNVKGNVGQ